MASQPSLLSTLLRERWVPGNLHSLLLLLRFTIIASFAMSHNKSEYVLHYFMLALLLALVSRLMVLLMVLVVIWLLLVVIILIAHF